MIRAPFPATASTSLAVFVQSARKSSPARPFPYGRRHGVDAALKLQMDRRVGVNNYGVGVAGSVHRFRNVHAAYVIGLAGLTLGNNPRRPQSVREDFPVEFIPLAAPRLQTGAPLLRPENGGMSEKDPVPPMVGFSGAAPSLWSAREVHPRSRRVRRHCAQLSCRRPAMRRTRDSCLLR